MIEYNEEIDHKLIETGDDFFEAAVRCSFSDSFKLKKYPLMIPSFTNKAFACELYLKATLYLLETKIPKCHKLDDLFLKLNEKVQKDIYNIWRTIEGQDIQDCDYAQQMFSDNLEANSDVFTKFRYAHEWWKGTSLSLESSFGEKQIHLHNLSGSRIGSPPIHDGFLDQFAKSIKKYNNELRKRK